MVPLFLSSYLARRSLQHSVNEWSEGSQRDIVYLGWLIAPSYMSPNAGGVEGVCGVSANEYSCSHGAQINFGDLTLYLTYARVSFTKNDGNFLEQEGPGLWAKPGDWDSELDVSHHTRPNLQCKYVINSVTDPNWFQCGSRIRIQALFSHFFFIFYGIFFGGKRIKFTLRV